VPDVDTSDADLAQGGELYRANCQACHSASGSGGALSYGRAAPRLSDATPTQVGAAVWVGPGQMPVFGPETISDEELNDVAAYVEYLRSPEDPGGLPIGRTGPIPEGFVAWLIGMVALLALVAWIGTRMPIRRRES
jgi:ubiquinol-cytochrome c reductase cytochrome c subunit